MMHRSAWRTQFPLLLALVWMVGCGDSSPGGEEGSATRIDSFSASPSQLSEPGPVTLSWVTRHADSVELLRGGVAIDDGSHIPVSGSLELSLEETTTFELIAVGARGAPATRTLVVEVEGVGPPRIESLVAPEVAAKDERGLAAVTVEWRGVVGADELVLEMDTQESVTLDPSARPDGSLEIELTETTTFSLIARNAGGEAIEQAKTRVVDLPVIEDFGASQRWVGLGETVELSWITSGAVAVELWNDEVQLDSLDAALTSGSYAWEAWLDSTIELRAFNELGASVTSSLGIRVGSPEILSFEASSTYLWAGQALTFSWETGGGSSLAITSPDWHEPICESSDPKAIERSSCEWLPQPGDYHLDLVVSNGSGSDARGLEVVVSSGPRIASFTATPMLATVGDAIEVRWAALPDPDGSIPTSSLKIGEGEPSPLEGISGDLSVNAPAPGPLVLELMASTSSPGSTPARAQVEVEVYASPLVTLVATPSSFDDGLTEDVALSWTSENAASLVLYRVQPGAEPLELLRMPEAERAAGELRLVPTEDATYLIVAINGAGRSAQDEAEVTLAPPRVGEFVADAYEIVAGEEVVLSWKTFMAERVSIDALDAPTLVEETLEPYADVAVAGTHLPMTAACGSDTFGANSCASLTFPDGFRFPFGGAERTAAMIHTSGVLSFDLGDRSAAGIVNTVLPATDPKYSFVHLAPFWDSLGWDPERYPTGNAHYLLRYEDDRQSLVIQWKDVGFADPLLRTATSLNFEVILWGDGTFEYRYGRMEPGAATRSWAEGASATVGFQNPSRAAGAMLIKDESLTMRGPLRGRSFRFRPMPAIGTDGSFAWSPYVTEDSNTITLTASRGELETHAPLTLTVLPRPVVELTQRPLAPVLTGTSFRIGWKVKHGSQVEIFDGEGIRICQATAPDEVAEGFCSATKSVEARGEYRIRATGKRGITTEESFEVIVFDDFGIESFEADRGAVAPGEPIELSWLTHNVVTLSLTADGVEYLAEGAPSGPGSLTIPSIGKITTFVLRATNAIGLEVEKEVTVETWRLRLEITPSASVIRPGEELRIDIDATALDGGSTPVVFGTFPMVERTGTDAAYVDLSILGGRELAIGKSETHTDVPIAFPEGFTFPYFGEEHTSIWAITDGLVSFDSKPIRFVSLNRALPDSSSTFSVVHLAPFWDDLHPQMVGEMWSGLIDPDTFVIQWKRMSMTIGSTDTDTHDLNFNLVLHRSGAFEYRYGAMNGLTPPATGASCSPTTCVNEAAGSAATIGYQSLDGTTGMTLHFGGTLPGASSSPFPGGLTNRTFRYEPVVGAKQIVLTPQKSGTYRFCSPSGANLLCDSVEVRVDFEIESFTSAVPQLAFGAKTTLNWKTKGGRKLTILEGSDVIHTTQDLAEIDAGSFEVEPTTHATYTLLLESGEREASASLAIQVMRAVLTAQLSSGTSFPGETVTLSWTLDSMDTSMDPVLITPMEELLGESFTAYEIEGNGDGEVVIGAGSSADMRQHPFRDGFTFNYLGIPVTQVGISTDGYLSFDTAASSSTGSNQRLPMSSTTYRRVHIAPFWDDLHTRSLGSVLAKKWSDDIYVIQWSKVSLSYGSTDANEGDLNFMVVLHRNGDFEFRYGFMGTPPAPMGSSACYPASCVNESNGSSATIGYQDPTGTLASVLYFGGTNRAASQLPLPGRLAFRSWKFSRKGASGSVQIAPWDRTTYQLCAIDAQTRDRFCAEPVEAAADWAIGSFQAGPAIVMRGEAVNLSWSVVGLDTLSLKANGTTLESFSGAAIPTVFSRTHTPSATTTYTLEGTSLGRSVSESRIVELRGFSLNLEQPAGRYFPGESVTLSWELVQHEDGAAVVTNPMREVPAQVGDPAEFKDISLEDDATLYSFTSVTGYSDVDIPFAFPYFGSHYSRTRVFTRGYLSFVVSGNGVLGNTPIPTEAGNSNIHLAPFWDELRVYPNSGGDELWSFQPDPDTFILQYTKFNRNGGVSLDKWYNLNFQVVLYSNGAFEYRYGKMEAPPQPFSSSICYPSTCELEVQGGSATIGYQTGWGDGGSLFHFGGQGAANIRPVQGGLAGRSLRFEPAKVGQTTVRAGETSELTICGDVARFRDCKSVWIDVVASPGDILFSELMIDPIGGDEKQWFELRNVSNRLIDLQGFLISSGSDAYRIEGPLLVGPGEFVTFAASSEPGFTPDEVYGNTLSLDRRVGSLVLEAGTATIASTSWGVSWEIPIGMSLELDGSRHEPGDPSTDDFSLWCPVSAAGTPGSLGDGCSNPLYRIDASSDAPFIDISSFGSRLPGLEGAATAVSLPVAGFTFPFFDQPYDTIWVSNNGWLSFSKTSPGGTSTASPTVANVPRASTAAPLGPLVAAFWDRTVCNPANFPCSMSYHLGTFNGREMLIVQWTGFKRSISVTSNGLGSATFQAQLWDDGTVVIAFAEMESEQPEWATLSDQYSGSEAWIALEGPGQIHATAHHRTITDLNHRSYLFSRK